MFTPPCVGDRAGGGGKPASAAYSGRWFFLDLRDERIADAHAAELRAMLHVFGIQDRAILQLAAATISASHQLSL